MTVKDLLKRLKPEDYDKVIIFTDGIGWTNVDYVMPTEQESSSVLLKASSNSPFSDDN